MTGARRGVLGLLIVGLSLALASCSFGGGIDVRGEEYAFENMPGKLEEAEHLFQFTNTGKEAHEMVVVRLSDGSASIPDVLRLPEQDAMARLEVVGRSSAEPGQKGAKVKAQLEPGRYALVCFLPVAGSGPPHFTRGMLREFTVG